MHALVASVLLRLSWFDPLDRDAESQPPDGELGEIEQAVGTGEGNTVVRADGLRQATFAEELLEGRNGGVFARRFKSFAQQHEARGMIGDGQWITVATIAELELALEVGAPQIVGSRPRRELGSLGTPAWAPGRLDQAVPVQDRVDRALGRNADVAGQPPHQELADLARSPMRLLLLESDDQAFDLRRQLVGVANRPPRAIRQGLEPMLLVAIEDLVAGLARDAELPAHIRHRLALQKTRHEP